MSLPELPPLQFAVLSILGSAKKSGREIRDELWKMKIRKSGPSFYQLMARLEDAKYVKGWYEQKIIDGQIIKERRYELLGLGSRAMNQTRDFYSIDFQGVRGLAYQ